MHGRVLQGGKALPIVCSPLKKLFSLNRVPSFTND